MPQSQLVMSFATAQGSLRYDTQRTDREGEDGSAGSSELVAAPAGDSSASASHFFPQAHVLHILSLGTPVRLPAGALGRFRL